MKFFLFSSAYAGASELVRIALLDRAEGGPSLPGGNTREYEIFNLLGWLHKVAPDCSFARARFETMASVHPDFVQRERPDLDVVTETAWVGSASPESVQKLLSTTPEDQLDRLISFKPQSPFGASRDGLLVTVSEAVATSYEWGLRLADALEKRNLWASDVWNAVLSGWSQSELTEAQWKGILSFLDKHECVFSSTTYESARLLQIGVNKNKDEIPSDDLLLSLRVMDKLWPACAMSGDTPTDRCEDWVFAAINHPAGYVARFWVEAISRLRKESGPEWKGIPTDFKASAVPLLTGNSYAADLARVVFALHLFFLFSSDAEWAVQNVVLLLNLSQDRRRAVQCWQGYLSSGRWNDALLSYLMPLYEQIFPVPGAEFGRYRDQVSSRLAAIALFSSVHPLKDGWLNRFLEQVSVQDRTSWASYVGQALREMRAPAIQNAWSSWMKQYWENRIEGIPLPLDPTEVGEMVEWVTRLESVFPDAVEKICSSPNPKPRDTFIYRELAESEYPSKYPDPTARLILHLLRSGWAPTWEFPQFASIFERVVHSANPAELLQICNELAKLGFAGAVTLRDSVPRSDSALE